MYEQMLLGALLLDNSVWHAVCGRVAADDFDDPEHRAMFRTAQRLIAANELANVLTVCEAGGHDLKYVNALVGVAAVAAGSLAHAPAHAAIVRERAQRRRVRDAALKAADNAMTLPAAQTVARLMELGSVVDANAPAERIPSFGWVGNSLAEIEIPRQLVEGTLTVGGMSVWYGASNSGKTYLALHLCVCVTRGDPYLGKRVEQGAVIYIAGEGSMSIHCRLKAFRKHFGREIGPFGLIPHALSLMDPSVDVEDLIELIRAKAEEIQQRVLLVVVDTLARAMGGANENASEDMSRLVAAGDRIRGETGAHVLFIHHSGKDEGKGARGHSSLRAAIDTEVEVVGDELTKIHTATITKQRDLPTKGERLAGRFVSVEVARDQWGGPVTACAVEDTAPSETAPRSRVMGPAQQAVLGYLAGQDAAVRKAVIVAALEPGGLGRASIYRAINTLIESGHITDSMGLLYAPKA